MEKRITKSYAQAVSLAKELIEHDGGYAVLVKFSGKKTEDSVEIKNISISDATNDLKDLDTYRHIAANSEGVVGWHKNGATADWSELL